MTYAPADLLAVREFLLSSTGLSGDAVGIVGDPDHASTGGYHEGNDDLARVGRLNTDYSKRESPRDRPGTNAASAIDYGTFRKNINGVWVTDRTVTARVVAACQRGDPRTADIREVIYTPDGETVRRLDRLGIRSSGDSSHLYHTHISFFRDSEGRRDRSDNILGLLHALIEGDDMAFLDDKNARYLAYREHCWAEQVDEVTTPQGERITHKGVAAVRGLRDAVTRLETQAAAEVARDAAAKASVDAAKAAIDALAKAITAAGGSVDSVAILARMDAIAAAESAAVAQLRAEVLSARQEAAQLREQLAERDERLADALDPAGG